MDYILTKMENALLLDEHLEDRYNLLKYHQARTEYFLVLTLAYLWNKNFYTDKFSSNDKLEISNFIGSKFFTIGTLIRAIEALDVENEIMYSQTVKKLYHGYKNTRNEEIGHGFNFSDASEKLVKAFEKMHTSFSNLNTFLFKEGFDIILVKQEDNDRYRGINLKCNGSIEAWSCKKSDEIAFELDNLYLQHSQHGSFEYFRLSPFIGVEREGGTNINYYIFGRINNLFTGCVTYNYLSKTGKKSDLEWDELANLDIISDGQIRVSKNGTTVNVYELNYNNFIEVGVTKNEVHEFLNKNKANVCANLWGHGGVGKTATIQKVCEELLVEKKKYFKYILFLSAKNTLFNTETGRTEEISEENRVDDYESFLRTINSIIFRDLETNLLTIEDKIINYDEGKLLLIVDDYESFTNEEKEKVIKFIGRLNIQYHKVIITTRSTVEIEGSKPIPINELDMNNTVLFFKQLLSKEIKIPSSKRSKIFKLLSQKTNQEKLFYITDGRPLFITYFSNILTRIEFEEALNQDIKSSKAAVNFLFGKLFDYLSNNAKLIFLAIGQMGNTEDLTYSLSHIRFVSKFETDEDMKSFMDGIYELEKYKIVKTDDSKLLIRIWAEEIIGPMMDAFSIYPDNTYKSVVVQRVKLIKENKKVDTVQEILFQEAEKLRLDGNKKPSVVESAYRRVLNSKDTSSKLKLNAIYKLGTYFISIGDRAKAIKVYSDFEVEFSNDAKFIKKFAYICFGSKERKHRNKSIQVLLDFIYNKKQRTKPTDGLKLELYGLIVMRKTTFCHEDIERAKNRMLLGIIKEKDYHKKIVDFRNQLKNIHKSEGRKLFNGIQKIELGQLSKNENHYIFNGLYQYVEVCIKLQQYSDALNVCNFVFDNAPDHFHAQFKSYIARIPKNTNASLKVSNIIISEDEAAIGDVLRCKILNVKKKSVVLKTIKSNEEGVVFLSNMSSKYIKHPKILFKEDQELELMKIGTTPQGNLNMSLRKLEENLYEGQIVKCEVLELFPKKVLVKVLEFHLLGEIYIRNISSKFVNDITDFLKEGEVIYAEVISVHRKYGIGLSLVNVPQEDDDYLSELGLKLKKILFVDEKRR